MDGWWYTNLSRFYLPIPARVHFCTSTFCYNLRHAGINLILIRKNQIDGIGGGYEWYSIDRILSYISHNQYHPTNIIVRSIRTKITVIYFNEWLVSEACKMQMDWWCWYGKVETMHSGKLQWSYWFCLLLEFEGNGTGNMGYFYHLTWITFIT